MRDLVEDLQRIVHADGDGILSRPRRFGDVQFEGQVAALVFSHPGPIHPDFGKIIHCPKAQDDDAIVRQPCAGNIKLALVPGLPGMLAKALVRLPGGGDGDRGSVFRVSDFRRVKMPLSIQRDAGTKGQGQAPEGGDRRHGPGNVGMEVLYQRGLLPLQDALRIEGGIIQSQVDQVLIDLLPAFAILPIHHGEEGEPGVADDRNAIGAQEGGQSRAFRPSIFPAPWYRRWKRSR